MESVPKCIVGSHLSVGTIILSDLNLQKENIPLKRGTLNFKLVFSADTGVTSEATK